MTQMIDRIEALVQPVLEDLGFELVDLEYKRENRGWVLRFFLDRDGGITLDDCADASREISTLLDVEDLISTAYNLEVSSPGLERVLKKPADFERFAGNLARISTVRPLDPDQSGKGRKKFTGRLVGLEGADVVMKIADTPPVEIHLPFDAIDKANLVFEF